MILKKADVVSLNQDSTIPLLLGSSFFYPPKEDKKFCLRLIYEILGIPNVEMELCKMDDKWDEYKDEILEIIHKKMPDSNSSFNYILENLKKKLFTKENWYEKKFNMEMEFKPGLILSAILNKKSLTFYAPIYSHSG